MSKHKHSAQSGAALVIGMILLTVITLLAVVGMNISNSELASATSEQTRLRAFQAAETAVEYAMSETPTENDIFHVGTKCNAVKVTPVTVVDGSPLNSATGAPTDKYTSRISYIDAGSLTDGYSSSFKSLHYFIETKGISARNASVKHQQGTYLVNQGGNQDTFSDYTKDCYVPVASGL
ncbi:MAG: PilX N-terminal domain-containing pilus assembly protein [Pseudomonadota bacterium]